MREELGLSVEFDKMSKKLYIVSPYVIPVLMNLKKWVFRSLDTMENIEIEHYMFLYDCIEAKKYNSLVEKYGVDIVKCLIEKKFLVDYEERWHLSGVQNAEIETTTFCNSKCVYCPVRYSPKRKEIMSMKLFQLIVDKLCQYGKIKYVTFNSYNEPCIDPFFIDRAKIIATTNLKIKLNTNGTRLNKEMVEQLVALNVLESITFNLPSVEMDEYKRMTSRDDLQAVLECIDYCISKGLDVRIAVQGTSEELKKNLKQINERFSYYFNNKIKGWNTVDRGGTLKNEYMQDVNIERELCGGCHKLTQWINISVDGDFFICCNDYYQKSIYASIYDGTINEIINSPLAITNRRYAFGDIPSPTDFLCRHCDLMEKSIYMYEKGMASFKKMHEGVNH